MKKTKAIAAVVIFALFCCLCIGYAALSDTLVILGNINLTPRPFEGVYIYDVELVSVSKANSISYDYTHPTVFSNLVSVSSQSATVTYRVTVHNNSSVTCWYLGLDFEKTAENNSQIGASGGITITTKDKQSDTSSTFNSDDWIPPNTMREFYVTYTYGASATSYRTTLVNFKFGVKIDSVHDKFLSVLNDKTSSLGYQYIADYFDTKQKEDGTTVVGNIGDDAALFDTLFGPNMTINVNGVETPVTVMVERKNVDKNTSTGDTSAAGAKGNEYTVYITVDSLSSSGGKAVVYAVSYTCDAQGNWYQLGQLYEGAATKTDYDTTNSTYDGAFDVSSWVATAKEYKMADGIVYKVGYSQGDQYDMLKTIEQLMSTYDQDIFNDIDNQKILKKVYDIIQANHGSSDPAVLRLIEAFSNAAPYYDNYNNGQEFKIKRNSPRAELIPYIVALQEAVDYYNQAKQT